MELQELILNDNKKIDDYGKHFIQKMIYLLLTDKNFLNDIWEILDVSLFENNVYVWFIEKIKRHFEEYRDTITLENIETYIESDDSLNENKTLKTLVLTFFVELLSKKKENFDFVREKTREFFKVRFVAKELNNCIPLVKQGKYDEIVERVKNAAKSGSDRNLGTDFLDEIDERYSEKDRIPIPTGTALDDVIGGLAPSELGVILANSSAGKSWLLQLFAKNALLQGYNVLFYTLEDKESFHLKRIDRLISHIHKDDIREKLDDLKAILKNKVTGKLKIKHYPPEITNTNTLMAHLEKMRLYDFDPDIVFIDYGDQMAPNKQYGQEWKNEKQVFDEIKSMADIENVPIWTATQGNRGGLEKEILDVDNIGGAYGKVAPSNIMLSLTRSRKEKENNTGKLYVVKNKDNRDSVIFDMFTELDRGIIEITKSNSTKPEVNEEFEATSKQHLAKILKEAL